MSEHLKLLTPELIQKVKDQVQRHLEIAAAAYGPEFRQPSISFDLKNHTSGTSNFNRWALRFNLILLVENEEKFLATTVPHEVAHLVAHYVFGPIVSKCGERMTSHGKEWREVMWLFNVPARVTHTYDVSSIQKPKRRPRNKSKLQGAEANLLIKRLLSASKRLPKRQLNKLIELLINGR